MALFIVAALGRKTAIVCNRTVLMDQWADAIAKFLGPHNVTKLQGSDSIEKAVKGDIMIASIDTLVSGVSRDLLRPFGLVVVDEMHHLAAATLVHSVPTFPSKYTLGLTATPVRSDGLEHALYWLTGPVGAVYQRVPEITGKTGTVEVRKIVFTKGIQKEIVYFNGTLGFSSMITELSCDSTRNALLIDILHWCMGNRNRTVVVTSLVEHAKTLRNAMPAGFPTSLMAGNQKDRAAAAKTSMIFATYSMLEEGYDDPTLDTLILATPRSNVQQTVGRIEREAPGKAVPLVFDIVDSFSLFPNMFWKRNKFYQSRGFHITQLMDSFNEGSVIT
jgi:superfamily II DNA or RNA helicase